MSASKWQVRYEVGERVKVTSALLWFLWSPTMPPGVSDDKHDAVFEAVVTERREFLCDPFWWGYAVMAEPKRSPSEDVRAVGGLRVLGYQLAKVKNAR